MLSDKCPRASNAFSCEPRGSQLPPPRRSVPGVSPPLCIGMGGLFLPWKGKKARMFGMWGDEEV